MPEIDRILSLLNDDEVIQVTRDLVAIPSITLKEGRGMVNYYEKWFKDIGISTRLVETGDGRANFFADFSADGKPGSFLFNGHQDTKPTDGMTIEPFSADIIDGKLYGRGAADMKSGIAATMCAMKTLVRAGITPKEGVTFFSDLAEESGSNEVGFAPLLKKGYMDQYEAMISCEPSDLTLQIGDTGGMGTAFEAFGRQIHTGLSKPVDNAIISMAYFITEYMKLPYLKVENPYYGKCTVNFEKIEGGLYLSTTPDRCMVCLDARFIPETSPEEVSEQINGLITRLKEERSIIVREIDQPVDWRPSSLKGKAYFIPPDHELVRRVAGAYLISMGREPKICASPATTFAGVMIKHGTPSVIIGPGSIEQSHTADEWIAVDQIPKATRIYLALMAEM